MWDLVINALPVHIFAKDPADDYRFVFSNRGMQDFTRLSDEEIRGKNDFDIYPRETAAIIRGDDEKNMQDLEHGRKRPSHAHDYLAFRGNRWFLPPDRGGI